MIFSGYSGFPINKTDRHDKTEILLKVALNTINPNPHLNYDNKQEIGIMIIDN